MVRQIPCVPCICRALHLNEVGDDIYTQTDGRTGRPENVRPSWTELICLYGIVQGGKKGSPTRGVLVCVCVDASVSLWCFAGKMRSVYLWLRATSPPPPRIHRERRIRLIVSEFSAFRKLFAMQRTRRSTDVCAALLLIRLVETIRVIVVVMWLSNKRIAAAERWKEVVGRTKTNVLSV